MVGLKILLSLIGRITGSPPEVNLTIRISHLAMVHLQVQMEDFILLHRLLRLEIHMAFGPQKGSPKIKVLREGAVVAPSL